MTRPSWLRRLHDDESGFGMSELIVTMFVTSIVLTLVASMFIQTARITGDADQTQNSAAVAGNIANELTSTIRMGSNVLLDTSGVPSPAVVAGTDHSLTIYSYVDTVANAPVPTMVTFDASSGVLIEDRCLGTQTSTGYWVFSGCVPSTRNLGGAIIAPAGGEAPLFTYLTASGNVLTPTSTGLSAADRAKVATILVSVKTVASGSETAPVYITSAVHMPNLGVVKG